MKKILRKTSKKATKESKGKRKTTREMENNTNTCPKQIEFRLLSYVKQYKDLPSRSSKGDGGRVCKSLYRRYGSLNNGFKYYGLPARHRQGTNVELVAPNGEQLFMNYNRDYDKDVVFDWMKDNCSILTNTANDLEDNTQKTTIPPIDGIK